MSAALLLERLRALDVYLVPEDDQLRIDAPMGVLSPELQAEIVRNKLRLLELLHGADEPEPALAATDPHVQALVDRVGRMHQWWRRTAMRRRGPRRQRSRRRSARSPTGATWSRTRWRSCSRP